MKKIEAKTLEEAYAKAAETFDCSVTDLEYEIVQHPSGGFLGIGAKKAIIVAACQAKPSTKAQKAPRESSPHLPPASRASSAPHKKDTPSQERVVSSKPEPVRKSNPRPTTHTSEAEILNGFFDDSAKDSAPARPSHKQNVEQEKATYSEKELSQTIETKLGELMRSACFEIDTVEVDVIDGTAYIFIDGDDAALLIGKEGYRYNALSYLLYNWLHNEYGLFIKLEIAQFLASQQEMIRNYIQPVIEHVQQEGWGKTRPLDGILVQIALEQLREEFPNKYVAIKRTRNGERYILINEFNKRT